MELGSGMTLLGIESGGTKTSVVTSASYDHKDSDILTLGPGNFKLTSLSTWHEYFRLIKKSFPKVDAIGFAVAGARSNSEHEQLARLVSHYYSDVPIRVRHDLESAFYAPGKSEGNRIICISGTGSCCYGVDQEGYEMKSGGWGHVLGDPGSGYAIGHQLLREVTILEDEKHERSPLIQELLDHFGQKDWEEMIDCMASATKNQIASAAPICIRYANNGDPLCHRILDSQAEIFSRNLITCLREFKRRNKAEIEVIISGGIMHGSEIYRSHFNRYTQLAFPNTEITLSKNPTYMGTLVMADQALHNPAKRTLISTDDESSDMTEYFVPSLEELGQSPTELRNPRSMRLDTQTLSENIELFLSEDEKIPEAIRAISSDLETLVERATECLKSGGRIIYVGAGTSGRLGVLDASECPPTFQTKPEQVVGILAGGDQAMFKSLEGAEDSVESGAQIMVTNKIQSNDVVIGIAASGRTPFVWGSLQKAKGLGACTALLTFNPHLNVPKESSPDLLLKVDVGPELLTGSTRLKSGTATKLVLNMLTTLTMVRLGKVVENLMVDVKASNDKLKARSIRILNSLTQEKFPTEQLESVLKENRWNISSSIKKLNE